MAKRNNYSRMMIGSKIGPKRRWVLSDSNQRVFDHNRISIFFHLIKEEMERFRIGDKIRIIHKGKQEGICTILDILEDYGGESYWLENEKGTLSLEIETPETVFEKIDPNKFPQAIKKLSDQSYLPVVIEST